MAALRRYKRRVALLVGIADLGGVWPMEAVTEALAAYADAACSGRRFRFVLAGAAAEGQILPPDPDDPARGSGVVMLAMGKHGARELNYSSDIDVFVFYDPDSPRPAARAQDVLRPPARGWRAFCRSARPTAMSSASICGCAPTPPRRRSRCR